MSSSASIKDEEKTEVVFVADEYVSSEEPPMDEWSSLVLKMPEYNKKKILYEESLYHPGSGEICNKYIPLSDSSVFRHLYYNYPAVTDPGIMNALISPEPPIIYPDDGQELYLAICKKMGLAPVRKFVRGLLGGEIDLRYYCVDPRGVRPMAIALNYNKTVRVLNLTDSFLSDDACYHLGEMLNTNSTIEELNLSGCRIKPSGALRLFNGLVLNSNLKTLNLNKNQLGDDGAILIANAVFEGLDVQKMYLSYNNIGGKGANALAEAFQTYCKFVELDLSWNNLVLPAATYNLLAALSESTVLEEINLSWNSLMGPRVGTALKLLLKVPSIKYVNASNNRLEGEAITNIIENLGKAKKLVTLDLSYNPMSPADALQILTKMKSAAVKVQNILLDNVFVNGKFLELLGQVKNMKSRKNFVITYGGVITSFVGSGTDPRELVLNRAEFLAKRPKKNPVDIALIVQQLVKDNMRTMTVKDFGTAIKDAGAVLDDDLVDEMCNNFSGPRSTKVKTINVMLLADYIARKWPDRKLPPTPPPEPEPEPIPVIVKAKGKEKGKGKGKDRKK